MGLNLAKSLKLKGTAEQGLHSGLERWDCDPPGGCVITEFHVTWLSQLDEGAEDLGQRLELSWW